MSGRIEGISVATPRTTTWRGREIDSAIWKEPVTGRVAIAGINVAGDDQANREVHGGPDQAVYAYAREDYRALGEALGLAELPPGSFGENLTLDGVDVCGALVGERWRVGTALLEVRGPRVPCEKLGMRMGDPDFPRWFAKAGRPGAYLKIVEAGEAAAGDPVEVVDRPVHDVTVALIARAYHEDKRLAQSLLQAPELPDLWRGWVQRVLAS
jgi:MOSC domain-containing protein YiiM